ncbi:hypothetical protein F5Y09DRAFT_307098 [Xylaria sp. FL1042]|nr:hypothetical protein F5Y09DRAFT_307098 [Xylaria sp. FL1042]
MSDVSVRQCELDWQVKPPKSVKQGHTLTVVARVPGKVEATIIEAFLLNEAGENGQRFEGDGIHTDLGFNGNEMEYTYLFFHIKVDRMGKNKIKFRTTWRKGQNLFGAVETLELTVADSYCSQFYSSEESNLLELLFHWELGH